MPGEAAGMRSVTSGSFSFRQLRGNALAFNEQVENACFLA
jgi:hypothetical protein